MIKISYLNTITSQRWWFSGEQDSILIGRSSDNDIHLRLPVIPERVARIAYIDGAWRLECFNTGVTEHRHSDQPQFRPVGVGESVELFEHDVLRVRSYEIVFHEFGNAPSSVTGDLSLYGDFFELVRDIHLQLIDDEIPLNDVRLLEASIDEKCKVHRLFPDVFEHAAELTVRDELLITLIPSDSHDDVKAWETLHTAIQDQERTLKKLVEYFRNQLGLSGGSRVTESVGILEARFHEQWLQVKEKLSVENLQYFAARAVKTEIKNTKFGRGPLELLWRIPEISEIMVVRSDLIYIETNGQLEKSGRRFLNDKETENVIKSLMSDAGREINNRVLIGDARSSTGDRINAVLPALALAGPCLTVRKFPNRRMSMSDLVHKAEALSADVAEFLRASVACRCNIIVCGGTGSGKTTLLNCLSETIHPDERVVTIEDTAELRLQNEHVVVLQSKKKGVEEGTIGYEIEDLVRNALRMRPDRIIVGECRGAEAMDMLQAMNTGHEGSMTTIHANSPDEAIQRLEVMVQRAKDVELPVEAIYRQIVSSVDLVVQLSRRSDGKRVVTDVSEFAEIDPVSGQIQVRQIYVRRNDSGHRDPYGVLAGTGHLPTFMPKLLRDPERGLKLDQYLNAGQAS